MSSAAFAMDFLKGRTARDVIDHWAETQGDAVYLIDPIGNRSITYGELRKSCLSVANYLSGKGLCLGDRVAYAMHNGPDTALVILGALYGGFVATAVNLVSGANTISYVLHHSGARHVFCQEDTIKLLESATDTGMHPLFDVVSEACFKAPIDELANFTTDDDALLMYTSGTTGVPKGVVHTHESLLAGGGNTALAHQLSNADRGLCVLPLYHINALCVSLLGSLASGGSFILPDKFSVSRFWNYARTHEATWFSLVPTQISYLIHEAENKGHDPKGLEALRFGRSASAPLSPDVQESFEEKFQCPIIETMGLTETAAQILSNPIDGQRKIGSPGIAFGNEVMIGDEAQVEVPRGTEGEVLVRGANVMRVYRSNEKATSETLLPSGWLRTGDLGKMDEDGYVYITGRLKELIIKGGENIAPREIDDALYAHPDVIEAGAFARECPQYGQRVEAGVMLREGTTLTAQDLISLCVEKVGTFKAPTIIYILPELPKGPSGKIQRLKIAELTV